MNAVIPPAIFWAQRAAWPVCDVGGGGCMAKNSFRGKWSRRDNDCSQACGTGSKRSPLTISQADEVLDRQKGTRGCRAAVKRKGVKVELPGILDSLVGVLEHPTDGSEDSARRLEFFLVRPVDAADEVRDGQVYDRRWEEAQAKEFCDEANESEKCRPGIGNAGVLR